MTGFFAVEVGKLYELQPADPTPVESSVPSPRQAESWRMSYEAGNLTCRLSQIFVILMVAAEEPAKKHFAKSREDVDYLWVGCVSSHVARAARRRYFRTVIVAWKLPGPIKYSSWPRSGPVTRQRPVGETGQAASRH